MTTFTVNGRRVEIEGKADTPLAYVLRNDLELRGVKLGCGAEQCGACRILVDGELRYSCTTPTKDVDGARLTTVEGLAEGPAGDSPLSAVQAALLDRNASQCGYCLSGIAIAAHALFERNPTPSREDIVRALDAQLCRCGAHPRVVVALLELSGRG